MILNYLIFVAEMQAEVRQQMQRRASFTACDISRAVQASGVKERHQTLKAAVHQLFETGGMPGYSRRLITLPSGARPFLYFPRTASANRFAVARNRQTSPSVRVPDHWNRLRFPARTLREAGFAPGQSVWVTVDPSAQKITLSAATKSGDRLYRVDRYNNIRLALGTALTKNQFTIMVSRQGEVTARA
jgi:hypothetical protein